MRARVGVRGGLRGPCKMGAETSTLSWEALGKEKKKQFDKR